jgi:anti-sigma regulatory factor (Ser/Thr protein kinase)
MSTLSARVDLPPTVGSVPTARRLAVELLTVWRAPHDRDDAGLVVSELVANVVDHVGGDQPFTLELTHSGDWLRISLVDGSAIRPIVRELEMSSSRGRGMRMVERIASRWGAEDHDGGKRVWVELAPDR